MRIDPFFIKRLPKMHPKRLLYTAWARWSDHYSRYFFQEYELPELTQSDLPTVPTASWQETQVLPQQAQYLLWALKKTEDIEGCVVEVGAWRGATTELLARNTKSSIVVVDPWIGESNEVNMAAFNKRTNCFPHITPLRGTFGTATRNWQHGPVRFIFIDAAHDYADVAHDLAMARWLLTPGGMIAMHDTDNVLFPGCRRAVYEVADHFKLAAHIDNLTIFALRN